MSNRISGLYVLYIKVSFVNREFKMAGSQMIIEFDDVNSYSVLRLSIIERIYILLERYENSVSNINHIILTFIPVDFTYINKFKTSDNNGVNNSVGYNFSRKTILPVYISSDFLGKELDKVVENNLVVDVMLNSIYSVEQDKLSRQFKIDSKLQKFHYCFKFYLIKLNNTPYLLAVKYITNSSIRKVRMNLSGNIMEDIRDLVLDNGNIKRVMGNNVLIICKDKIIKSYVNISLSPIKSSVHRKKKNIFYLRIGTCKPWKR